jgi:hypothetical protein
MTEEQIWDDNARAELREALSRTILGEQRLAKNDRADILDSYCADRIRDECPEDEWDAFFAYSASEFDRIEADLHAEQASWPAETDCDRLDRVEATLLERNIVMWQASPCCDTCTRAEFQGRIDALDIRSPGLDDRIRGYCFFIDQNLPEMLTENTELSIYFAYGWLSPDRQPVEPEVYEKNALAIAHEVCECLRSEGFEVEWDGSFSKKFGTTLDWRRKNMLV